MSVTTGTPDLSRAAIHGTAWRYLAFFSGKLLVFISTVVLARILTKDDFGIVGYAVTALSFLDVVSDLRVGPALIYYPEDKRMFSTAFWLNMGISLVLFSMTWFLSPFISDFFREPRAGEVTRILALTFPLSAFGDTHDSILRKRLSFGLTIVPDILQAATKGLTSILFAFLGFGPWSLIWGQILGAAIGSIVFWIVNPWRPSFEIDFAIAKKLLNYGVSFVGGDLLSVILLNLDYLLVGRYLGPEALGVYTIAFRMPDLLIMQFARILSSVIFPIYTHMRDLPGGLARGFYTSTRYVSLVTVPLGLGLALVAKPFILAVFTDKWIDTVPVLQGLAIYAALLSLVHNASSAYKANGRLHVITILALVRLSMLFPALWWAVVVMQSISSVGIVQAAVALVSVVINLIVVIRILGLPFRDLLVALRPALTAAFFMALSVYGTLGLIASLSPWPQLIIAVLVGAIVYTLALWVTQRDVVEDVFGKLLSAVKKG